MSPPILSAYLNTKAQNASRHPQVQSCVTWLKKKATSMSQSLEPRDAERFGRIVDRVEHFLDQRRPEEKALVIFGGPEHWTVIPLQIGVENELRWGKPALWQLFRLLSEQYPSCIVVVDHHAARFFMNSLGELTLLEMKTFEVDISQWKKKDLGHFAGERVRKTRGPQREVFEDRLEAQYGKLCQETAERAAALCGLHNLTSIFLVGPTRLISPIQAKIPCNFAEWAFVVPEDLGNFSPKSLLRRLKPVIDGHLCEQQIATATRLLGADHGATIDVDETLAQLQKGAIRHFILARDFDPDVQQCTKCGWVSRSADPVCLTCGAQRRTVALSEILPELLVKHGARLEIVSGDAARILKRAGGMGGWLYQASRAAAS
jgi:hypothetical protein